MKFTFQQFLALVNIRADAASRLIEDNRKVVIVNTLLTITKLYRFLGHKRQLLLRRPIQLELIVGGSPPFKLVVLTFFPTHRETNKELLTRMSINT